MADVGAATIRLARFSDAEAIQEISAEAYVPAYRPVIGVVPKPAYEDYTGRIERGEVWLLESDDGLLGALVLEPEADHLVIYSVAVCPQHQGRGYGRLLLAFAEERAAAMGRPELRLYTNRRMERNLAFYRNCGFLDMGMRQHPSRSGEIIVDMVKPVLSTPAPR